MQITNSLYEIIALAARYWFVLLVVIMVLVAYAWMWQDRMADHHRRAELPDAGMIGYLQVLRGCQGLEEGTLVPIPREGILGCIRGCDVCIPAKEIRRIHADYEFVEGKGIFFIPRKGCTLTVNGVTLAHRSHVEAHPLRHHGIMTLGEISLQLLLFAGIEAPEEEHPQALAPFPEGEPPLQDDPSLFPAGYPETEGWMGPSDGLAYPPAQEDEGYSHPPLQEMMPWDEGRDGHGG